MKWGPWIGYNGEGQPVADDVMVEVCRAGYGIRNFGNRAGYWHWRHDGGNGDIIAYRVEQKPVVETVELFGNARFGWVFGGRDENDTYRLTFTITDGKPDPIAKIEKL